MKTTNRREFIQSTALLLGAISFSSYTFIKRKPLLSFSTLGCPDWTFKTIVDFAVKHNYNGLEIRGLQRQLDITKSKEFNTPENRNNTLNLLKDKGLSFVGLGSSATLHFREKLVRDKNLDEGRRFIDLAQQIECPYIRVFPNIFPKDQERNETIDLITSGLLELAEHAKGSKVKVLMETHGEVVKTDDLLTIMNAAKHKHIGLVWDISNMWTITQEPPSEVYQKLKKYIKHTHIKDAKMVNGKLQFTLLGQGDVPIFSAIDELVEDNYKGYYSFEWEKLWHPEIAEPEIALAHFPIAFQNHIENYKK